MVLQCNGAFGGNGSLTTKSCSNLKCDFQEIFSVCGKAVIS